MSIAAIHPIVQSINSNKDFLFKEFYSRIILDISNYSKEEVGKRIPYISVDINKIRPVFDKAIRLICQVCIQKNPLTQTINQWNELHTTDLPSAGIPTLTKGHKVIFWSGEAAMKLAMKKTDACTDKEVPAFRSLFKLIDLVRETEESDQKKFSQHRISSTLYDLSCRCFALLACGDTILFISREKTTESRASLSSCNHFWDSELQILRALQQSGTVKQIKVCSETPTGWTTPVSIDSAHSGLLLRRRFASPQDLPSLFYPKDKRMTSAELAQWKSTACRPQISFDRLRAYANKWMRKTFSSSSALVKKVTFADRPSTPPVKAEVRKNISSTLNHIDIKKFLAGNPIPTDKATKLNSAKFTPPPTTPPQTARPSSPITVPKTSTVTKFYFPKATFFIPKDEK